MIFNSSIFFLFFVVFLLLYTFVHNNVLLRNIVITLASYVFYGWWDVRFLTLVALSTSTDYCAAIGASGQEVTFADRLKSVLLLVAVAAVSTVVAHRDYWILGAAVAFSAAFLLAHYIPGGKEPESKRKYWLLFSLIINFGLLFVFKYFNFFLDQGIALAQAIGLGNYHAGLKVILPVGLSFFTFQATGRTIDSYTGRFRPARNIVNYAAFHAFFPQLVAGPIERAGHLMPQFEMKRPITSAGVSNGVLLFIWGLYKKIVADNVALMVEPVFAAPNVPHSSADALLAVLAFTIQIYGDFSGYSDMARGIASIMGFDLMRNFNIPYAARSPSEFWRRWHISLSQWLRDFIFIPLGGSRNGETKTYRNLMVTMILGGLWHGASWTFCFWGFYHGAIQIVYRALRIDKFLDGAKPWSASAIVGGAVFWAITMVLVMIGWVFFRAGTFHQAADVISTIAIWHGPLPDFTPLIRLVWPLVLIEAAELMVQRNDFYLRTPVFFRYNFALMSILLALALGTKTGQQFIYFDF